jgi:hypothetical protein
LFILRKARRFIEDVFGRETVACGRYTVSAPARSNAGVV